MGKDENVRTLCYKCKQNYESAGYKLKSIRQNVKQVVIIADGLALTIE